MSKRKIDIQSRHYSAIFFTFFLDRSSRVLYATIKYVYNMNEQGKESCNWNNLTNHLMELLRNDKDLWSYAWHIVKGE